MPGTSRWWPSAPDGQTIVAGGEDAKVHFWNVATGEPRTSLDGHELLVRVAVFSRDGRLLASAGAGTTVSVCDPGVGGYEQDSRVSLGSGRRPVATSLGRSREGGARRRVHLG